MIHLAYFASGVVTYPFVEYAVHRWILHGPWDAFTAWRIHGAHHHDPDDPRFFKVPGKVSAGVAAISFLALPPGVVIGWLVGFYVFGVVHAGCHGQGPLAGRLPRSVVGHHAAHHARSDRIAYAVSVPFVDRIFGTRRAPVREWACGQNPMGAQSGRAAGTREDVAIAAVADSGRVEYVDVVVDGVAVRVRVWRGAMAEVAR